MHGEALTGMRALLGYPPPHHPAWHHVALPRFDAHPPMRIEAGSRPIGWLPRSARLRVRQRTAHPRGWRCRRSRSTWRRCAPGSSSSSSTPAATTIRPTGRAKPAAGAAERPAPSCALARRGRRLGAPLLRPLAADRPRPVRRAPERLGGRGLLPLGRPSAADRHRMGVRGALDARLPVGAQRLGMDRRRLPALSGLRARPLPRLLAALVRQPSRTARRLVRHPCARACAVLSQFRAARPHRPLRRLSHRGAVADAGRLSCSRRPRRANPSLSSPT